MLAAALAWRAVATRRLEPSGAYSSPMVAVLVALEHLHFEHFGWHLAWTSVAAPVAVVPEAWIDASSARPVAAVDWPDWFVGDFDLCYLAVPKQMFA